MMPCMLPIIINTADGGSHWQLSRGLHPSGSQHQEHCIATTGGLHSIQGLQSEHARNQNGHAQGADVKLCHAQSFCLAQASLYLQHTLAFYIVASCSTIAMMTCTLAIRQDLNQRLYSWLYIERILVYIRARVDKCLASLQIGLLHSLAA